MILGLCSTLAEREDNIVVPDLRGNEPVHVYSQNQFLSEESLTEYEPRHDKTNEVTVHPAKTQISLGIHPV